MRRARAYRHPPHLQTETALLSRSPGARSREWSSFVCMAERPNQSKHVLSRRCPPRTLRRSRWRLCPGFLRSVPFYSAVSFCCSRESGHGRLSVPHAPANERHTRSGARPIHRHCRSANSPRLSMHAGVALLTALSGANAQVSIPPGRLPARSQKSHLLAPRAPAASHPCARAIRADHPQLMYKHVCVCVCIVCTLCSAWRSLFWTQQTLPLGLPSSVRALLCTRPQKKQQSFPRSTLVAAEPRAEPE